MSVVPYSLARPFLFALDAETAHDATLDALAAIQRTPLAAVVAQERVADPVTLAGVVFPNRVGLAAGLDKNARCIDGFGAMGFGSVEVGTVTPLAQPGNARPRLFRIAGARALVNRFGFNNDGLAAFVGNVRRARFRERGGVVGCNIGKNAATPIERAGDDYAVCLTGVYPYADYVTVNISSPNTANLRTLQDDAALDALLDRLARTRERLAADFRRVVPLFVKVAPDLDDAQVEQIATRLRRHGIDGVVATNTTLSRDGVAGQPSADEAGGLSGAPLLERSNRVVSRLRQALGPAFPIIGVGGVLSAADALAKRAAGADLVQLYTGLVYKGPSLVTESARALAAKERRRAV